MKNEDQKMTSSNRAIFFQNLFSHLTGVPLVIDLNSANINKFHPTQNSGSHNISKSSVAYQGLVSVSIAMQL